MPTHVELVTPERVLYSGEAEFVVVRAEGGEIMFLPHHADFIAAVDICVVRIALVGEGEGHELRAAMAGGFAHVADNRVTVLASVAELGEEIDVERARRALEEAEAAEGERPSGGERPGPSEPRPEGAEGEEAPSGSAMVALLQPDLPEVRARRARARLEAAGALGGSSTQAAASSH